MKLFVLFSVTSILWNKTKVVSKAKKVKLTTKINQTIAIEIMVIRFAKQNVNGKWFCCRKIRGNKQ